MKKTPLLIMIIITSLLVTVPGVILNAGLVETTESYNYGFDKVAASSTIHEIKTRTSSLVTRLSKKGSGDIVEEALEARAELQDMPQGPENQDRDDASGPEDASSKDKEDTGEAKAEASEETPEGEAKGDVYPPPEWYDPDYIPSKFVENPLWATVDDSYFIDACFIGDSRTKGFGMYSGLETTTYAKVGLQLYKVFDDRVVDTLDGKLTVPEALAIGPQFGKIYLMFGLNEMGWGNDDMFIEEYCKLIDTIKGLQPGAIIYVQQVIHVSKKKMTASPTFRNDRIDHRNELLKQMALDEGVYYIELNEVFTDEEGNLPEGYSFDGVHMSGATIQIWKDYLKTHAITADTVSRPPSEPEPEEREEEEEEAETGEEPAIDPATGFPIDPATGYPVDPATGRPFDPATGLQIDPATGFPIDPASGLPINPATGQPAVPPAQ